MSFALLLIGSIALGGGMTGCRPASTVGEENDPPPSPVRVRAVVAERRTLRPYVEWVGTIKAIPERSAEITARIAGQIDRVDVVEGETVQSGQTLVELDPRVAQTELERANGIVAQRQAVLDRLQNGYRPEKVTVAREALRKAEAEAQRLRLRIRASEHLSESGEISQVQMKQLKSALHAAEADVEAARAQLALLQKGPRPEEIREAAARLAVAQAERQRAAQTLSFCRIAAPLAGIVTRLTARRGMQVSAGDRLATIVDPSALFVRVRVPGVYLDRIRTGNPVEVTLASPHAKPIPGRIVRFAGEADPRTGDIDALARIENPSGRLRPGFGCRVRVWLPSIPDALAVPLRAVADRNGTTVVSVARDGKAFEVEVTVGATAGDFVQITSGLSEGDHVIVDGGYGLPEGCPVKAEIVTPGPRSETNRGSPHP